MVTRVSTVAFEGIEARAVDVQVQISAGNVVFMIVGLADKAVAESRERVRSALIASGLALPAKRITVNLAPADLPKEGSHYDLPIALGVMAAIGAIPADALADLEPREVEPDRDPPRVDAGRDLAGEIVDEGADVEAAGRVRRIEQAVRRRQRRDALRHGKQAAARLGALRAARLEEDDRGERLEVLLGEVIEFAQAPRPRLERCLELRRAAPDLILNGGVPRRGRGPARGAGFRLWLDAPRRRTPSLQHTPPR